MLSHGPLYGYREEAGDRLTAGSSTMTGCNPQRFSWPPGALPQLHLIFCNKKEKRRISILIQEAGDIQKGKTDYAVI